jgi:hypothetical protein
MLGKPYNTVFPEALETDAGSSDWQWRLKHRPYVFKDRFISPHPPAWHCKKSPVQVLKAWRLEVGRRTGHTDFSVAGPAARWSDFFPSRLRNKIPSIAAAAGLTVLCVCASIVSHAGCFRPFRKRRNCIKSRGARSHVIGLNGNEVKP